MGDVARGPRQPGRPTGNDAGRRPRDPPGAGGSGAEADLVGLARMTGRAGDPAVRQAIARIHALRTVNRWNGQRAQAQLQQGSSSPIPSLGKLAMSRILHEGARVQALILGAEAMLTGPDHPRGDAANFLALNASFTSIGGGTDEIQRNIIGERLLGLPREPEVDRNIPFRQVRSGSVEVHPPQAWSTVQLRPGAPGSDAGPRAATAGQATPAQTARGLSMASGIQRTWGGWSATRSTTAHPGSPWREYAVAPGYTVSGCCRTTR